MPNAECRMGLGLALESSYASGCRKLTTGSALRADRPKVWNNPLANEEAKLTSGYLGLSADSAILVVGGISQPRSVPSNISNARE